MQSKKLISISIIVFIIIAAIVPVNAANYEYDALGRLTKTSYSNDENDASKSVGYSYDAGGNITAVNGFSVSETTTETTTEAPTSEYVWNYSNGTNTDNFFTVSANEWSSAETITYGDLTLNRAVKMESNSSITFTAPQAGTLKLVTYSTNSAPTVKLNGTSCSVSSNGVTEIEIAEGGSYTITKDTTNTYLYYMSFTYQTATAVPYVWNYTDGTNTDNFYTVSANEWTSAVPITYNDDTLTRAIKMETNSTITFTAPSAGTLTLVTYSTKTSPAVNINGQSYAVAANSSTEIQLTNGGAYSITKDTTNTYLYYISFCAD